LTVGESQIALAQYRLKQAEESSDEAAFLLQAAMVIPILAIGVLLFFLGNQNRNDILRKSIRSCSQ
jgi:hypothetical protein